MKNISTYFYAALIAILSLSFASCDEDDYIAYQLDGTWKGTISSGYDTYFSVIRFYQIGNQPYGDGFEYDDDGWNRGSYAVFDWSVSNGTIILNYYEEGYKAVIYDYRMRNGIMTGYITNAYNGWDRMPFTWTKVSNNWDNGYNDWHNHYFYSNKKPTPPLAAPTTNNN